MYTTRAKRSIDPQYIMADFPESTEITDKVIAKHKRHKGGVVRIQNGMYRTKKESDEYIKESLERELP